MGRVSLLQLRNVPGKQNLAQLVTTSSDHLAFGHGQHACPGRFFAANEVKIVLAIILTKYEFELPEGAEPKVRSAGFAMGNDPFLKMRIRKRTDSEGGL